MMPDPARSLVVLWAAWRVRRLLMHEHVAWLSCQPSYRVGTLSIDDEWPETLLCDAAMWFSTPIMAWREMETS